MTAHDAGGSQMASPSMMTSTPRSQRGKADRYYARWDEATYPTGTSLTFAGLGGRPTLKDEPELAGSGWPGMPRHLWRVGLLYDGDRSYGFEIRKELPIWQWLGPRGDAVLAAIDTAAHTTLHELTAALLPDLHVEAVNASGAPYWLSDDPSGVPPWGERGDLANWVGANTAWLLRSRLESWVKAVDPDGITERFDVGCGGPERWVLFSPPWDLLERATLGRVMPWVMEASRRPFMDPPSARNSQGSDGSK